MYKFFTFVFIFFLFSCGFQPLYKKTPYYDLSAKTALISIPPVKGFDGARGVDLRNNLLNKLTPDGKPDNPSYSLNISLSQPIITDYTIKNDGIASSYLITLNASYSLIDLKTKNILLQKNASSQISYNILKDQFSTEMLKINAIKLAINSIAEQIYFSVITYLANN